MRISMSDSQIHLEGAWALAEMKQNRIDSMALSLGQMESGSGKDHQIDCGKITDIDASGLGLFSVWLQCLNFRGLEPKLTNFPDHLHKKVETSGFRNLPFRKIHPYVDDLELKVHDLKRISEGQAL